MQEFKIIKNFENYSISNFGNVRNDKTGRIMKKSNKDGYKVIGLTDVYGIYKHKRIHRLIAEAFIPNPDNKPFIDHINNQKDDNRIDNLRWCTPSENSGNTQLPYNNTSGLKGVYFLKSTKKWRAQITINGINKNLGNYTNKEDALKARLKKSVEIYGEFINKCELIQIKRLELDQELIDLEKELQQLIDN